MEHFHGKESLLLFDPDSVWLSLHCDNKLSASPLRGQRRSRGPKSHTYRRRRRPLQETRM